LLSGWIRLQVLSFKFILMKVAEVMLCVSKTRKLLHKFRRCYLKADKVSKNEGTRKDG